MSDKIAEIRERHSRDDRWRNTLPTMHDDRATLLAEIERLLDAENERLREALEITPNSARVLAAAPTAEEIDCLRAANKGLLAEVDRQRAENERLDLDLQRLSAMGSNNKWLLERLAEQRKVIERLRAALEYMVNVCPAIDPDGDRAHEQARKALEGKP